MLYMFQIFDKFCICFDCEWCGLYKTDHTENSFDTSTLAETFINSFFVVKEHL